MKRVLVLPGDVRYNLGDIAILLGVVRLVRGVLPDAEITVCGHEPCLPGGLDGVRFVRALSGEGWRAARAVDIVLWGGGQLLQGNRSRIKIPYWLARVAALRLLGRRILGFGQGVGPLPRVGDRLLTRLAVEWTERFAVRDRESVELLAEIRAPREKVVLAADPALVLGTAERDAIAPAGERTIGVSLRYTRHHRSGRIIPFQLLPERVRTRALDSPDFHRYLDWMTELCDRIVAETGSRLVFIPMYYAPWETDEIIAESLGRQMTNRDRVRVFRPDSSVEEILVLMRGMDAYVGTPMHSTILATSQRVPTLALNYEPKGRDFFRLIGQQEWVVPLESVWETSGRERLLERILALWERRDEVRTDLEGRIPPVQRQAASNADHLLPILEGRP
jgi:polysaccharide pyruvyl transferase WcaK-like protein